MYAVKSFVWCNKSYFMLMINEEFFFERIKNMCCRISRHDENPPKLDSPCMCNKIWFIYFGGGGCILILKPPQIKLMSKACKLSVFLSTVKCLTNMELYSSLADDVHRITSMWGHDIKPVFDDFRCWTSRLNNRSGWFSWVTGSLPISQ